MIRPHLLGIQFKTIEDRQAFVHFWAVIGHMIGVKDCYNMCLFDYETVEIICQIVLRYMFMPLVQIESNDFRQMVEAFCTGMSTHLPFMSYDVQIFKMRRITGVPGYQFNVNCTNELICRQIFSKLELNEMQQKITHCHGANISEFQFLEEIPLIEMDRTQGDDGSEYVIVDAIDNDSWHEHLGDEKFWELSPKSQRTVKMFDGVMKFYQYRIGRWCIEMAMSFSLFFMRKFMRKSI